MAGTCTACCKACGEGVRGLDTFPTYVLEGGFLVVSNGDMKATLDAEKARAAEETRALQIAWGDDFVWLVTTFVQEYGQKGGEVRGFALRAREDDWLLVVRVGDAEGLRVAFTSKSSPTGCVSSFRKRWTAGDLNFLPDRYA